MQTPSTIAVIGAGLAGLSCASALQRAGYTVTVFEKSRSSGGRMSTRRGEDGAGEIWQCDHGAQYFTARDPSFHAQVQHWISAGAAAPWVPRLAVMNAEPATQKTEAIARFVGTPHMTSPVRHLAENLNVRTQTTVQALQREANGWALRSAEHNWLPERFDAVVLAVPAPQAVPLLQPVQEALAGIASNVRMRGSWALMLRYSAPLNLSFDAAFVNTGPLRWVARNSSKPQRSGQESWLLHASAAWSDAHIEDSADAIAAELLAAFAELGGIAPDAWSAHRWRYADTEQPLQLGAVWQAADGIGLCGDWLNGGKVEGAWLSGQTLAEQIALSLRKS